MSPAHLFIHIGTHKTGSTAIQSALRENASLLGKEGIVFMPVPKVAKQLMMGQALDSTIISRCRDRLQKSIKDAPARSRFLWSFEGFSGNPDVGYENAHVVAESLGRITDGLDVSIIAYLRRQDEFIESLYAQTICAGASCTFESFAARFDASSFDWARLLHGYSEHFGRENIIVQRYDKGLLSTAGGLLGGFAQIIGSECLKKHRGSIAANRGYSPDALEIMRLAHPHLDEMEKKRLQRALHQASQKQPFASYNYLSFGERQEILDRYSASNAEVAREYFNEPDGGLFALPDPSGSHPHYQGISGATVVFLAKAVVAGPGTLLLRAVAEGLDRVPRVKSVLRRLFWKLGLLKQ
ncbi:MAG: hypothetical protein AB1642_08645 [Pseudomonadota bacterium]